MPKTEQIFTRVDRIAYRRLKVLAEQQERSIAWLVRQIILEWLDEQEAPQ